MGFSKYPKSLDDNTTIPITVDLVTPIRAEVVNRLRDAILSIESELGLDPSRIYATVRARLDAIEAHDHPIIELSEVHIVNVDNPHEVTAAQVGSPAILGVTTDCAVARFDGISGQFKDTPNGPFISNDGDIKICERTGSPTTTPNCGTLYVKDDAGKAELCYVDDDGKVTQITTPGGGTNVTGEGTTDCLTRWGGSNDVKSSGVKLDDSDNMSGGTSIAVGTTPALTGPIRLPDDETIKSRNLLNTRDICLIGGIGDDVKIGDKTNPGETSVESGPGKCVAIRPEGSTPYLFDAEKLSLGSPNLEYQRDVNNPKIHQEPAISDDITAEDLFIGAQPAGGDNSKGGGIIVCGGAGTGTGGKGGDGVLRPGSGTDENGNICLQDGYETDRVKVTDGYLELNDSFGINRLLLDESDFVLSDKSATNRFKIDDSSIELIDDMSITRVAIDGISTNFKDTSDASRLEIDAAAIELKDTSGLLRVKVDDFATTFNDGSADRLVIGISAVEINDTLGGNRILVEDGYVSLKDGYGNARLIIDDLSTDFYDSFGVSRLTIDDNSVSLRDSLGGARIVVDDTASIFDTNISFSEAKTSPTISQVDEDDSTGSQPMLLRAQSNTFGGSTGGNISMGPGSGTTTSGILTLQDGAGTPRLRVNADGTTTVLASLFIDSATLAENFLDIDNGSTAAVSAANHIRLRSNAGALEVSESGAAYAAISTSTFDPTDMMDDLTWSSTHTTPSLSQAVSASASGQAMTFSAQDSSFADGTGGALTINAGDASGSGTTITGGDLTVRGGNASGAATNDIGGALILGSGTGTTTDGNIQLQIGGIATFTISDGQLEWDTGQTQPTIKQADENDAGIDGEESRVIAQNVTGSGTTVGGRNSIVGGNSTGLNTNTGGLATMRGGNSFGGTINTGGNTLINAGVASGAGTTNTGANILITAGSASGASTNVGGDIILQPGAGDTTDGKVYINDSAGINRLWVDSTSCRVNTSFLSFWVDISTPIIRHDAKSTADATGQTMSINSQDVSGGGTATVGGHLIIRAGNSSGAATSKSGGTLFLVAGNGATSHGQLALRSGDNVNRLVVDTVGQILLEPANGLVAYGATVANPRFIQNPDSTGSGEIFDIGGQDITTATGTVAGGPLRLRGGNITGASTSNTGGYVSIEAGNATNASTNIGGIVYLTGGTGSTANGNIIVRQGGTVLATFSSNIFTVQTSLAVDSATLAENYFDLENGSTAPLSASNHVRFRSNAGTFEVSESGGAYAAPGGGSGTVSGTGTDNRIAKWDGTGDIQDTSWTIGITDIMEVHRTVTPLLGQAVENLVATGDIFTFYAQDVTFASGGTNTGGIMRIQGGDATNGSTNNGGSLQLHSGAGANNDGAIYLRLGGTVDMLTLQANLATFTTKITQSHKDRAWGSTVSLPRIYQETTSSANGQKLQVVAQATTWTSNSTGGQGVMQGGASTGATGTNTGGAAACLGGLASGGSTNTGGAAYLQPGTGTTINGRSEMRDSAGTARVYVASSGDVTELPAGTWTCAPAGVNHLRCAANKIQGYKNFMFNTSLTSPLISQDSATGGGQKLTIQAQDSTGGGTKSGGELQLHGGDCSGGTDTGGNVLIKGGDGDVDKFGYVNIQSLLFMSGNDTHNIETLTGNKTLNLGDPHFHKFDANSVDRTITLPAENLSDGLWFEILGHDTGTGQSIEIENDAGGTVQALFGGANAEKCFVICDGTTWLSMGAVSVTL